MQTLFMCHKMPERSFFFKGKQFPLCARCTGILLGYLICVILPFTVGTPSLVTSCLLGLPIVIDGGGQLAGKWQSTNSRRFITGVLGGIAIIYILVNLAQFGYGIGLKISSYF